jgi:hypothetical protein
MISMSSAGKDSVFQHQQAGEDASMILGDKLQQGPILQNSISAKNISD